MIRRPPRSTRTDTLFPYTTLFRSGCLGILTGQIDFLGDIEGKFYLRFTIRVEILQRSKPDFQGSHQNGIIEIRFALEIVMEVRLRHVGLARHLVDGRSVKRSEERRGGKACVSTCRYGRGQSS